MTTLPMTPEAARTVLSDVIRTELRGTWERGMDTAPHGPNALNDKGAPAAYETIMEAADDLAAAIAALWRDKGCPPAVDPGTDYDATAHRCPCGKPDHPVTEAPEGSLAVCHSAESFTLKAGHRMRAARCLICHLLIGSGEAAVIGVAALAGNACRCGGVVADLFLIHASHIPMPPDDLAAAVHRGLACPVCHPAD